MKLNRRIFRVLPVAVLLVLMLAAVFPGGIALADDPEVTPTEAPVLTEPPAGNEPAAGETIAETVAVLEQTNSMLLNEQGQPEPLATETAAAALAGDDPYIVRGGSTYRFFAAGGCAAYPGELGVTCFESATPVQAAINFALAGETIFIQAGTYVEQLFITKDITLQGEPGAKIQSPATVNLCYNTPAANEPIVCVKDTNNVSILDLEIDGAGQGNGDYRFEGIGFFNAGGTIQGNVIHAIRETPLNGTQHGVGIYAYNLDGTPRTIVVDDNLIYDFQKNGMALNGNNLTAIVTDNTVIGSGPLQGTLGMPAQNGIQIGSGATGVVSGNTISDIWYVSAPLPATDWSSVGIMLFGASGTVEISDNQITDTKDAIYIYSGSTPTDTKISGNLVLNCEWGIVVFSSNGTLVSGEIAGNTVENCTVVSVYTDNPDTTVNGNNFSGNGTGVTYDDYFGQGGQVDATGNYWGCPGGPNTPGCDTTEGAVLTEPFATEPIVPPTSGSDGSAGDGTIPPAAEDYLLIRADSGTPYALSCQYGLTIAQLPNGDRVLFYDLCSYNAKLTAKALTELPGALPADRAYTSAMEVVINQDNQVFEVLPNGVDMTVSFVIPAEAAGKQFAILYWDPKANTNLGAWVELPNEPGKLYPDKADDLRRLAVGVYSGEGRVKVKLNFTGLFVLVTK